MVIFRNQKHTVAQEKAKFLQRMFNFLLVQQERTENRCKSFVEQLSNVKTMIPTSTPLNPYIELPMHNLQYPYRHTILEHFKKGFFCKKQTFLVVLYLKDSRLYRVEHTKTGLFGKKIEKQFTTYVPAFEYFMDLIK